MAKSFQHKKSLGQHFLKDEGVALDIVEALQSMDSTVLEIGPGLGVLTKYLVKKYPKNFFVVDLDDRLATIIPQKFPTCQFIHSDVLKLDFQNQFASEFSIIGNFPYNISTEIIFKVIENRNKVVEVVGMFQKEVAQRFASKHGSKVYGVTSVLTQAYYDVDYLFDVPPHAFDPPPKVQSGVIRLVRKKNPLFIKDEKVFFSLVKAAFGQRRKMLSNAIKPLIADKNIDATQMNLRAEQLSVEEFVELANKLC